MPVTLIADPAALRRPSEFVIAAVSFVALYRPQTICKFEERPRKELASGSNFRKNHQSYDFIYL
jgi:hypothetical protein